MISSTAGYKAYIQRGMINRKQLKKSIEVAAMKSGFVKWLEEELEKTKFDISDEHCTFYINRNYDLRGSIIVLQTFCCPKIGSYQGIQFRPKIYVNTLECMQRPKVYNDRRIFHPNINIFSCEFISKELIAEWNPTREYNCFYPRFQVVLNQLKYLIIEPNCYFVPNNPLNRKAAWNYYFNRSNFWKLIIQNTSIFLDSQIALIAPTQSSMDIEHEQDRNNIEFWSIEKALPKRIRIPSVLESLDSNQQDNFELLAKKIKTLHFDSDSEMHEDTGSTL